MRNEIIFVTNAHACRQSHQSCACSRFVVLCYPSGYGFSQWGTTLQCNVASHWLITHPLLGMGLASETTLQCNVAPHWLIPYPELFLSWYWSMSNISRRVTWLGGKQSFKTWINRSRTISMHVYYRDIKLTSWRLKSSKMGLFVH